MLLGVKKYVFTFQYTRDSVLGNGDWNLGSGELACNKL